MSTVATALLCLALNVYYEARGESYVGKEAVAHVVMNRLKAPEYPDTVCEVVYQPGQFSWIAMKLKKPQGPAWEDAQHIAQKVLDGESRDPTLGATHFHNTKLPYTWNKKYTRTKVIGLHAFYKKKARPRGAKI